MSDGSGVTVLQSGDDELDQHYFVALAMLLERRGGSFTFSEDEYQIFKARMMGWAQIIITQKGPLVRLDLMQSETRRDN